MAKTPAWGGALCAAAMEGIWTLPGSEKIETMEKHRFQD